MSFCYFQKLFLRGIEAFLEKSADDNYQFIDSFDLSEILDTKYGWHFSNRLLNVLLLKYGEHTRGGAISLKNFLIMIFKLHKFVQIYKNGKESNERIDLEEWLCCVMYC